MKKARSLNKALWINKVIKIINKKIINANEKIKTIILESKSNQILFIDILIDELKW